MIKSFNVRWQISGIRQRIGTHQFVVITDAAGRGWVYIPYSPSIDEHIEAYKDANAIVDMHNKAFDGD
jgi:hypothetical protein